MCFNHMLTPSQLNPDLINTWPTFSLYIGVDNPETAGDLSILNHCYRIDKGASMCIQKI